MSTFARSLCLRPAADYGAASTSCCSIGCRQPCFVAISQRVTCIRICAIASTAVVARILPCRLSGGQLLHKLDHESEPWRVFLQGLSSSWNRRQQKQRLHRLRRHRRQHQEYFQQQFPRRVLVKMRQQGLRHLRRVKRRRRSRPSWQSTSRWSLVISLNNRMAHIPSQLSRTCTYACASGKLRCVGNWRARPSRDS
jgi:hypothetical protein